MPKAQINPIEQNSMVQGQASNLNYKPVTTQAQFAAGLSQISQNLGNVLYEQGKRIEKLKFADNDEKLKITSSEMNLALSKAQNQEEFDAIKKDYTDRMKADSKARLGKLYDKWNNVEGQNFMSAMEVDIKGHQIALNDKIAKETANSTIDDMAYQWGYAPTEQARKEQDALFAAYLAESDFNDADKEKFLRKYNHDKEHGYLTQEITKNPAKVQKLLADTKNFDNLSIEERESFKKAAETAEKKAKEAADKGFDEKNSLAIGSVKSAQMLELERQIANIQLAGTGKNIDTEKLNYADIMGTLDYIDSLSKDPVKINGEIVQTPSGQVTYTLSQKEALEHKKQILPYLMKASQDMLDGNTGISTNSVYAEQLNRLTEAAKKSGKMTPYEVSDLMVGLWRENQKNAGVIGQDWSTSDLSQLGNMDRKERLSEGMRIVKSVIDTYNLKKGNTGLALYTVPTGIKTTITESGGVVFESESEQEYYKDLQRLNETRQQLSKQNPFIYSFMLAAEKNI
jgi:hypothetical protein